jgi:hypothetical protein
MRGAIPSLPDMPSWLCAQLRIAQDSFTFHLLPMVSKGLHEKLPRGFTSARLEACECHGVENCFHKVHKWLHHVCPSVGFHIRNYWTDFSDI